MAGGYQRQDQKDQQGVTLQMTPMIDIVFQLLVFFVMTFKIVAQEGDFSVRMPLSAPREGAPQDQELLPLRLRLRANPQGELAGILLNDRPYQSFEQLNNYIIGYVGEAGPEEEGAGAEVELDCDYNLRYEYTIQAITAVSGYVDPATGQVVRLIEKVKFAPPRTSGEGAGAGEP